MFFIMHLKYMTFTIWIHDMNYPFHYVDQNYIIKNIILTKPLVHILLTVNKI